MLTLKDFNVGRRVRLSPQKTSHNNHKIKVLHQLFKKCVDKDQYEELDKEDLDTVHPWLRNAVKGRDFILNYPYPSYFDYDEHSRELRPLKEIEPPYFFIGDTVIMTFRVGFHILDREWGSDIMPDEFIRVSKASDSSQARDAKPYPAANKRRRLEAGVISIPEKGT